VEPHRQLGLVGPVETAAHRVEPGERPADMLERVIVAMGFGIRPLQRGVEWARIRARAEPSPQGRPRGERGPLGQRERTQRVALTPPSTGRQQPVFQWVSSEAR
jgi:hypothetical protein